MLLLVVGVFGARGLVAAPLSLPGETGPGPPRDGGDADAVVVDDPGVAALGGSDPLPPAPPDPLDDVDMTVDLEDWERLADCESGDWDADGEPEPGSARWDYGLDFDHGDHFQGGLNFHPDTWEAFREPDMPAHAGRATRAEEIEVAERVLDRQGWGAWPVCSEMMDLDD